MYVHIALTSVFWLMLLSAGSKLTWLEADWLLFLCAGYVWVTHPESQITNWRSVVLVLLYILIGVSAATTSQLLPQLCCPAWQTCYRQKERNNARDARVCSDTAPHHHCLPNPTCFAAQLQSILAVSGVGAILISIHQCELCCLAGQTRCSVRHLNPKCLWQHGKMDIMHLV